MSPILTTPHDEIACCSVGELVIGVYGPRPWDDACWEVHCEQIRGVSELASPRASLNYAPTRGPNAAQRKRTLAVNRMGVASLRRVTLVTESALVRTVFTAFGWLVPGPEARVYAPEGLEACLEWMAAAAIFDVVQARDAVLEMRRRVGLDSQARSA
jgi:hypothetical protein